MRFMGQCAPAGLLVESTGLLLPVAPCLFSALYLAVLSALGGRVVSSHRRRERLQALPKPIGIERRGISSSNVA